MLPTCGAGSHAADDGEGLSLSSYMHTTAFATSTKMPDARSTFDPSQCLDDVDAEVTEEYNEIIDAAVAAKDKYKLYAIAREMKGALENKQAELKHATNSNRLNVIQLHTLPGAALFVRY